jgi:ribonuclease J
MLAAHAQLARDAGLTDEHIVIAENGSVVELTPEGVRLVDRVTAGVTFVDGLGVGDVEDVALRDRRRLSEDGVLIVVATLSLEDGGSISPPELIARGVGEDPDLVDDLREEASRIAAELSSNGLAEIKLVQEHIHDAIGQAVYDRTRRRPMILPIVIEV